MMNRTSNGEARQARRDGMAVARSSGGPIATPFRLVGGDDPGVGLEPIRIAVDPSRVPVEVSVYLLTADQWVRLPDRADPGGYYYDRACRVYYRITERPTG